MGFCNFGCGLSRLVVEEIAKVIVVCFGGAHPIKRMFVSGYLGYLVYE